MKKISVLLSGLCLWSCTAFTQNNTTNSVPATEKKFGIAFSGFIRADYVFDSRMVESSRDQLFDFFPAKKGLDANGVDTNARPSFNQYAMVSRLAGTISGPDAFGAKTMAYLEGDFTGPSSVENNAFRLRHAYMKLSWTRSELLMGQYWHPLNIPEMIPYTVALNTGAPFHPFSRQPQARFTYNLGKLKIVAVASSERDNASKGPLGDKSEYLRYSVIPNLDAQLQFKNDKWFAGIAGDYRKLTPRFILTPKNGSRTNADESLDCYVATAFAMLKTEKVNFKFQALYGQNMYEHTMMGGIAVHKKDTITDHTTYTTLDQLTGWFDISTNFAKFNYGILAGYAKNMGSLKEITGTKWGRGLDIDYLYRVSPRVSYKSGNITLMAEIEYTNAAYGIPNNKGIVKKNQDVANFRGLFSASYTF